MTTYAVITVRIVEDGNEVLSTHLVANTPEMYELFRRMTLRTLRDGGAFFHSEEQGGRAVYDVFLTRIGDSKIGLIKQVRELTTLGLKEAKELVESVTPDRGTLIKTYNTALAANQAVKLITATGSSAEIKRSRVAE